MRHTRSEVKQMVQDRQSPARRDRFHAGMKLPQVYTGGISHFFGEICRSTLLRSSSFGRSVSRIHPRVYARGLLQRRIKLSYLLEESDLKARSINDQRVEVRGGSA